MKRRGVISMHLLLFMDLNGTIIAYDSAKNKDIDSAVLQLLAENYIDVWDATKTTERMTYQQYLEKHELARKAQSDDYKGFIHFLEMTNHPLKKEILSTYYKIKNILRDGDVFPSFLRLIHSLNELGTSFTIILRSFGNDAHTVVSELEKRTNIKFIHHAVFKEGHLISSDEKTLKSPDEILASVQPMKHGVWQDDHHYWHTHSETHFYGKPYPINFNDRGLVSIFFDDNAESKEILSIQPTSASAVDQAILQRKLIASGRIVPVNTMNAILNDDYFTNCVEFALRQANLLDCKVSGFSYFQPAPKNDETNFPRAALK